MDIMKAMEVLGIVGELDPSKVKEAFNKSALIHHPDKGGCVQDFLAIKEAAELLTKPFLGEETACGTLISTLGKGLPLSQSAVQCDSCEGRGYHTWASILWDDCPTCEGKVYTSTEHKPCHLCKGSGIVNKNWCQKCQGSGFERHLLPYIKRCLDCSLNNRHGLLQKALDQLGELDYKEARRLILQEERVGQIPTSGNVHYICENCKGIGEIEMFNPALPKRLAFFHKSSL